MFHWLIGPSGSGKSTVGRELAARRSAWFIDLDEKIGRDAGMSVAEIFAEHGEEGFRARERDALLAVVADHRRKRVVVATGGGSTIDPRNRDLMRSTGVRILLRVDAGTALERLGTANGRPLLAGEDPASSWRKLLSERSAAYADHDISVDAAGSVADVTERIARALSKFHTSLWRINAQLAGETSRICALRSPYSAIRAVRRLTRFTRRCVITDENLSAQYERTLTRVAGNDGLVVTVEPGEESKSFATVESIVERLLDAGFTRGDCIVGFGGGVVTDLAGFVASIYMRGLRCISMPTSLLAMVDASVGGKTAINAAATRNLVGTFRQPTDVLICDSFLRTLPERELRSGMVEALKMGMIRGGKLHELVAHGTPQILAGSIPREIADIVHESILAKLGIIGNDVHDEKNRHLLNLGHTFGHALEAACPGEFTHGEAVAFGIVAAGELAARVIANIDRKRIDAIVEKALPYTLAADSSPDFENVLLKMTGDKKQQRKGWLRFVLPAGGQTVMAGVHADGADALAAMELAWERIINFHGRHIQ